jgi:transglutaminase-like putative cysteine protease
MKYDVVHSTRYTYEIPATLCHNLAHLTPRNTQRQRSISSHLEISPRPAAQRAWTDIFGNGTTYFSIEQTHRELTVLAQCRIEVFDDPLLDTNHVLTWKEVCQQIGGRHAPSALDPCVFMCRSNSQADDEAVREFASASFQRHQTLLKAAIDLTARIHEEFQFDPFATNISTPTHELLRGRRGVCQDFAQLGVACFRAFGLAARYVSGYLVTRPPLGQPRLIGADATHAWVSVYFPGTGWIDFDPTNNRFAGSDYITLAWGRDYADVSPVRGVFLGGGMHRLSISVDVLPLSE